MIKLIEEIAPIILDGIKNSSRVLLHCHPSPDPDSVGSALAMKFALEGLGKEVTVIKGDSDIPEAFMHFPGAKDIVNKNFWEIDIKEFDLFIILDSSLEGVSRMKEVTIPESLKVINIDHHRTNSGSGSINLIDITFSSTAHLLFELFKQWNLTITPSIATNLFVGMYTDSGGFRYRSSDYRTLEAASELAKIAPDYTETIFVMENSYDKNAIYGQALALSSIETYYNDSIVISAVSRDQLSAKNISSDAISQGHISSILKSVIGWNIAVSMTELENGKVKVSFRTRDSEKWDVSKIASSLGGGGHKGAAGVLLSIPLEEAVQKVVLTAKLIYNL